MTKVQRLSVREFIRNEVLNVISNVDSTELPLSKHIKSLMDKIVERNIIKSWTVSMFENIAGTKIELKWENIDSSTDGFNVEIQ